ncbi:MAG: uracil-xanthine permease [Clostridia bacterium]|nr:uracil-xanthine permease [Clostridia bacterium]
MKMIYGVKDRPKAGQLILFSLQQLLAILAATIAVPMIIGNGMSPSAALFGAGVGTIVYLLFTKFKSPVFLGSSFAFLGSMGAAFAGGVSASLGYLGLIIGAIFAGLVYVIIAIVVKFAGVKWVDKIMPAVVIGPTVAIIGLSLAGNAIGDLFKGNVTKNVTELIAKVVDGSAVLEEVTTQQMVCSPYVAFLCGLITLAVTIICSVYGKKLMKMIPFVIGILSGYLVAAIFTGIGHATHTEALQIINFSLFQDMQWYPEFAFLPIFKGGLDAGSVGSIGSYIGTIAVAYIPVAFVVFAEHIADHKNISSIIEYDLLKDPGLTRTLLGDGVGSMAGAIFGGCPNTTYGESVGCVAISGNASVVTILTTAILAILFSFIAPFVTFLSTIPSCVMGGVCVALYGFIAVSGLKMIQGVDLGDNKNLFVVSVILIAGVGGMTLNFGSITVTEVACALILGILVNLLVNIKIKDKTANNEEKQELAKEDVAEITADATVSSQEQIIQETSTETDGEKIQNDIQDDNLVS